MHIRRTFVALTTIAVLLAACGDDDSTSEGTTTTAVTSPSTTTTVEQLEQPAIWPAAAVVLDTPDAAAQDFVTEVLGVPPALGEFQQGDARSGEIEVFSPGEGGGARVTRSTLLLRRLGPEDGWFVLAAINENVAIASPATGDPVPAEPLTVTGQARGFEANVVVSAFGAGRADSQLDQEVTSGGAFEAAEPYSVTLDLSDAAPGETVVLLVRGGTGLETDPGEFSAIPVLIAAS